MEKLLRCLSIHDTTKAVELEIPSLRLLFNLSLFFPKPFFFLCSRNPSLRRFSSHQALFISQANICNIKAWDSLISVFADQCLQQCNGYCHKSCNHTDNKTRHVEVCCIGINIHFLGPPYLISRPVCCRYVSDHKYCCHSFHLTYVQSSVIHLEDCYNSLILYYTHYTLLLSAFHSLAVYVLRHSNNNFPTYEQTLFLFLTVT